MAALTGCAPSAPRAFPTRVGPPAVPETTLVWVGTGEAERYVDGEWRRAPEFDYEFSVEQRRYAGQWQSIKSLRRRHPAYDGSAGPREETWFFNLELQAEQQGQLPVVVVSSLGDGQGRMDSQFRAATLEMKPEISSLAPFNTYLIEQRYLYEEGSLEETVSLTKREAGGDAPIVRNRERARLFAPQSFSGVPGKASVAAN
jgi:hypothetical protein